LTKKTGDEIEIEQRNSKEVTHPQGIAIAKESYPVYNPAFDVTPGNLITAIVLETGICRAPYQKSLRTALSAARNESK
jgi:methylthioribose-1-phosphate isomerase